ncbi:MAG: hypothetical protein HZC36_07925 [Armatimonadetes bacterium]|nr:hypothetical protein [Armatimonadota bacterium]
MKQTLKALLLLAVATLALAGCSGEPAPTVMLLRSDIKEWRSPEDGKTYLVAMPTWKVEGDLPVAEVWGTGRLTGTQGSFDFTNNDKPIYRADALDPGTTLAAQHLPEDGVLIGEKDEVIAKIGDDPKLELWLWGLERRSEAQGSGSDGKGP